MNYELEAIIEAARNMQEGSDKAIDCIHEAIDAIKATRHQVTTEEAGDILDEALNALEKSLELIE